MIAFLVALVRGGGYGKVCDWTSEVLVEALKSKYVRLGAYGTSTVKITRLGRKAVKELK